MKKILLHLCTAGAVLLASLVTATAADSKLVVAMLPKSKGNAYFISCKVGADKAAKELGVPAYAVAAKPTGEAYKLKPIRIGLVDTYGGSMPSGWTRWMHTTRS